MESRSKVLSTAEEEKMQIEQFFCNCLQVMELGAAYKAESVVKVLGGK